jgi:Ca2+-binding RTX toxin-like protein
MTGGSGADIFSFLFVMDSPNAPNRSDGLKSRPDLITDFTPGEDKIILEGMDSGSANQAFTFLGAGAFSGHAGELRVEMLGGRAHIFGDVDGDGRADLHIIAVTPTPLQASDFVL